MNEEKIARKTCVVCGKSFIPHKYNQEKQIFCNVSRNCSNKHYRTKRNDALKRIIELEKAGVL